MSTAKRSKPLKNEWHDPGTSRCRLLACFLLLVWGECIFLTSCLTCVRTSPRMKSGGAADGGNEWQKFSDDADRAQSSAALSSEEEQKRKTGSVTLGRKSTSIGQLPDNSFSFVLRTVCADPCCDQWHASRRPALASLGRLTWHCGICRAGRPTRSSCYGVHQDATKSSGILQEAPTKLSGVCGNDSQLDLGLGVFLFELIITELNRATSLC